MANLDNWANEMELADLQHAQSDFEISFNSMLATHSKVTLTQVTEKYAFDFQAEKPLASSAKTRISWTRTCNYVPC